MEKQLSENGNLRHDVINFAQSLLHQQFPNLKSFENTSLLVPFSQHGTSFIQIFHDGDNHWVAVAGSKREGDVDYFDSLSGESISSSVFRQISQITHTTEPVIRINRASVQQQTNGVDCGLFAIAFLTEICFSKDPREAEFNEKKMRRHLLSCFRSGLMLRFPSTSKRVKKSRSSLVMVEVYCICRDVFFAEDNWERQRKVYGHVQWMRWLVS